MGECTKMCIALVSVGLLLGCAAPLQETQQIRCTDGDGEILYTGPYNEKAGTDTSSGWTSGRVPSIPRACATRCEH